MQAPQIYSWIFGVIMPFPAAQFAASFTPDGASAAFGAYASTLKTDLGVEFRFDAKSHGEGVSLSQAGADKRTRRDRAKKHET